MSIHHVYETVTEKCRQFDGIGFIFTVKMKIFRLVRKIKMFLGVETQQSEFLESPEKKVNDNNYRNNPVHGSGFAFRLKQAIGIDRYGKVIPLVFLQTQLFGKLYPHSEEALLQKK